jgi:hypothetical protein
MVRDEPRFDDGIERANEAADTGRRGFGKLLLAGAAGAAGLAGAGSVAAEEEWHDPYFATTEQALPAFYGNLPTRPVVEEMLAIEHEVSDFFEVLGERVEVDDAEIVGAWVRPKPCGGPIPEQWDHPSFREIIEMLLEDMEDGGLIDCYKTWCEDPRLVLVPTTTFTFRSPERVGFGHIDPVGTSRGICPPLCYYTPEPCDIEVDAVRWTEDGWLDEGAELAFDDSVYFGGDPVPLPA